MEYPVPPLGDAEAVDLFSARSGIAPDDIVAELCRRLDNLPLAVELAAARAAVLSPAQMIERLSQLLDLLKGGRDADARQQTLRATIAWSHDLLSSDEQRLFARLSVFRGGSTLESAEEVTGADIDQMQSLVDKSLLRRTADRFRMLETIREYAAERLAQAGEETEIKRGHAHHVLELVERGEPLLHGREQMSWLDRLASETDNVRGALEWSLANEPEAALRLATAASWFWQMRSQLGEGRGWVDTALAAAPHAAVLARARAFDAAGRLAYYAGDFEASRGYLERAVAAWRRVGARSGLARSLTYLGLALGDLKDPVPARAVGEEAVVVSGGADDWTRAMALWALGANHVLGLVEGWDIDSAEALLEESRALFRAIGDAWGLGAPTYYLSRIAFAAGDLTQASVGLSEAIESMRRIGDKWRLSDGLIRAGEIALQLGNPAEAKSLYEEAVSLLEEIGNQERVWDLLARIANIRREEVSEE
ncbi:MAG: hypothetical protein M3153_09150 [Chloroflexota bacterium]|nr:hypothetical protein [Chloroflexota bacterium]